MTDCSHPLKTISSYDSRISNATHAVVDRGMVHFNSYFFVFFAVNCISFIVTNIVILHTVEIIV